MYRADLEHIIRAAGAITGTNEIVIIGSQSILGQFPDAPQPMLKSNEADVFTFRSPDDASLIDGTIGELTSFHTTFGFYAHGVAGDTARLPRGWRDRLIKVRNENTNGVTGLCLEVHDLCASKLIAGREKDMEFVTEAVRAGLTNRDTLIERVRGCDLSPMQLEATTQRLSRI
jgi:hypothetical protein